MAGVSLLSDDDLYLFNEGSHYRLYEKLGSHLMKVGEVSGCYFAVWARETGSWQERWGLVWVRSN